MWRSTGSFLFDLYRLFCHGLILAIILGFLGNVVPAGDSLAIFRPEFTVLLAIAGGIALGLGRTLIPMLAAVTVIVSITSFAPYWGRGAEIGQADFTLHQHNILFDNKTLDALIAGVLERDADVLTFQEVGDRNFKELRAGLAARYPHYQACLYTGGGVAVMAKDIGALLQFGCVEKGRLAWMQLETERGPVTFASIHQLWPWPMGQFNQKPILTKDLKKMPQPIVMAGDFNNVPWSSAVSATVKAAGGKLARGLSKTYLFSAPWPMFRIDHVVVPRDGAVAVRALPSWGSDHVGLFARILLSSNTQ